MRQSAAQIDARELEAQLKSAEASFELASSTAKRSDELWRQRIVTAPEYERDRAALASARFPVLFDVGSRVGVGEAMDAVLSDGVARAVTANLLINRGQPLAVRVAVSAVRGAAAIEGGLALIARHHG